MAGNVAPNIITDGMILYLDSFNANSFSSGSTTWRDISGNNRNASLTNVQWSSNNIPYFAYTGSGTLSYGTLTNFQMPVNAFTLNFTFNLAEITSSGFTYLFFNAATYATASYYVEITNSSRGLHMILSNSASYGAASTTNITVNTGSVNDMVYSYDGSVCRVYQNGIFINQLTVAPPAPPIFPATAYPANIGSTFNFSPKGYIYRVIGYNRALSATEVLQNYNATKGRFGL